MAMRVFNLSCAQAHVFEGWFASADAFADQASRQLIACPVCGSTEVTKMLSAPRINLGASEPQQRPAVAPRSAPPEPIADLPPGPSPGGRALDPAEVQKIFFAMARKVMESTEDVGDRFVDEARKIHYEEAPNRAIRGSATREEAAELQDEGIEVFALPVPASLKGPLQ